MKCNLKICSAALLLFALVLNSPVLAQNSSQTYTITYHHAGGNIVREVLEGQAVSTPTSPDVVNCPSDKVFMGWSETEVPMQQTVPIMVDGNIANVSEDKHYYAVYASKNGGKKVGKETTGRFDKFETDASIQFWVKNNGNVYTTSSSIISGCSHSATNAVRFNILSNSTAQLFMTTQEKISDLSKITFWIKRTGGTNNFYYAQYSVDSINWNDMVLSGKPSSASFDYTQITAVVSSVEDAYVRILVTPSGMKTANNIFVDDVQFYYTPRSFYYTDYSTTCNQAVSTTMTFDAGTGTGGVAPITISGWVTLPDGTGMSNDCGLFAGWQVTGVDGYTETFQAGESFLLNHDVTMTAQWTAIPCAQGTLDTTTEYITSAISQTTQSIEHTLTITVMDGDMVTPVLEGTGASMFTINGETHKTDDVVTSYTFRVQYTPTEVSAIHSATLVFNDANGKHFTDGSGNTLSMSINGRAVDDQVVLAAKVSGQWYALPANMEVANKHIGLPISVDDITNPTFAMVVSTDALYTLHTLDKTSTSDASRVRFASTLAGHKALWGTNNTTGISIKNFASVDSTSAKGDAYDWIITTSDLNSYEIQNNGEAGQIRSLSLNSDHYWGLHTTANIESKDIRILAVGTTIPYIAMTVQRWLTEGFTYTTSVGIPTYTSVKVYYAGVEYMATVAGEDSNTIHIDGINYDDHSGEALTVVWYNVENRVAMGVVNTPIFIQSMEGDLSAYEPEFLKTADVQVSYGGKLNISGADTVKNLMVMGGATVNIKSSAKLVVTKLSLQGGWTMPGASQVYAMPRVYIAPKGMLYKTNPMVEFDLMVDKNNYYPLAVPFEVAVDSIDYADPKLRKTSIYGKHYVIKTYDGAQRAIRGENTANWVTVESGSILKPGVGYIITAVTVANYDSHIRIPLYFANEWTASGEQSEFGDKRRDTTYVVAYTGTMATEHPCHAGWNFVANPYLSCFSGTHVDGDIRYVTIPVHDFSEYRQLNMSECTLSPEWSFFVQVNKTGTMNFVNAGRVVSDDESPIWAPKREIEIMREVETSILLSHSQNDGTMLSDCTGLIVSNQYSREYEVGADLEKMFGNGYTLATYTILDGVRYAFNAISENDLAQTIPIGFRAPESGEYTFLIDERFNTSCIECINLIDYQTGQMTNLLKGNYTFETTKTQDDERFAISVLIRKRTPTNIDDVYSIGSGGVRKFLNNDKLFIERDGVIFDITGMEVSQ